MAKEGVSNVAQRVGKWGLWVVVISVFVGMLCHIEMTVFETEVVMEGI